MKSYVDDIYVGDCFAFDNSEDHWYEVKDIGRGTITTTLDGGDTIIDWDFADVNQGVHKLAS